MPSFEKITSSPAGFASITWLYDLKLDRRELGAGGLLVEAFAADDSLQTLGARDVTMAWTNAALRADTRFTLTQGPLAGREAESAYVVRRLVSVGVNNLPTPAWQGLAKLLGPIPELLKESLPLQPENLVAVIAQARDSGYANHFAAIRNDTPWRPVVGEDGLRSYLKPTARGSQRPIMVGADGGADKIYRDKLGIVRIRSHLQQDTCRTRSAEYRSGDDERVRVKTVGYGFPKQWRCCHEIREFRVQA